jgi:ABC-type amino acid transport substrate-binding protein
MGGASILARSGLVVVCAALLSGTAAASRGTIVVATDGAKKPYAFLDADGHTVRGLDADLARAVANELGYRVRIEIAPPGTIGSGIGSGDYDLGMSLTGSSGASVTMVRLASAPALPRIAVARGSGMAREVAGALRTLVSDGTYRSLVDKWGLRATGQ